MLRITAGALIGALVTLTGTFAVVEYTSPPPGSTTAAADDEATTTTTLPTQPEDCIPSDPRCQIGGPGEDVVQEGAEDLLDDVEEGSLDEQLADLVDTWADGYGVEGVAVALSRPDEGSVTYATGTGTEDGDAMSADRVWTTGSITKGFTATLAAQLVDEGLIGFDDPLPALDRLPDFPYSDQMTLRQLLDHSSGLQTYQPLMEESGLEGSGPLTPEAAVRISAEAPLLFKPGTGFEYSSSGYLLTGLVIEQVSGVSYEERLRSHIVEPLGLTDTTVADEAEPFYVGWSTGGIRTSVVDLARFMQALGSGELVSDDTLTEMTSFDEEMNRGLGMWGRCPCTPRPDGTVDVAGYGHNGPAGDMIWFTDDDLAIGLGYAGELEGDRSHEEQLVEAIRSLVRGRTLD